jgi:hypothetical protein
MQGNNNCEKQTNTEQDEDEDGNAANELRLTVRALWKTGLEVFIHQLLYRRGIYPRDTFCSTRFVGAECKINNNPGVLKYIAEALKDIIPAVFGDDDGDQKKSHGRRSRLNELLIEIYDQATEITYEQFSLSFSSSSNEEGNKDDDNMITTAGLHSSFSNSFSYSDQKSGLSEYVIGEVERELRDLVCSTGKLERSRSLVWGDSISFKIILKINQRTNCESLTELDCGLDGSKWSKTTSASNFRTGNRVLFNLSNFACQFQYRLISSEDKMTESP